MFVVDTGRKSSALIVFCPFVLFNESTLSFSGFYARPTRPQGKAWERGYYVESYNFTVT